jgi:hypothetical protein
MDARFDKELVIDLVEIVGGGDDPFPVFPGNGLDEPNQVVLGH